MSKRILIVDDESSIRKVLAAHLERFGYEVEAAPDGGVAVRMLDEGPFHLVVTDLKMPVLDGMGLLRWVKTNQPGLPVILITAHGTVDSAVEAIKQGAFDYVTKPFDRDELRGVIEKAIAAERRAAADVQPDAGALSALIGTSAVMCDLRQLVERVARSPTSVLISGESGTGKELVARALHDASGRVTGPFLQVHCGAIPPNLLEAELFGTERAGLDGPACSKPGRFELAHRGTLFLDEVGELPRDVQVKVLRTLQEHRIERVGGTIPVEVDVRVVAATDADLLHAVRAGTFREDLYYRLGVIPIRLPPLRQRAEDIPVLVRHFLERFDARLGKTVKDVSPEAMQALLAYPWPGNIRELENLMERSVLLSDGVLLEIEDLPALSIGAEEAADGAADELGLKEYVRVHLARIERARIRRALEAEDGNVTRAARILGISRKSLQTKMKDYGLRDS